MYESSRHSTSLLTLGWALLSVLVDFPSTFFFLGMWPNLFPFLPPVITPLVRADNPGLAPILKDQTEGQLTPGGGWSKLHPVESFYNKYSMLWFKRSILGHSFDWNILLLYLAPVHGSWLTAPQAPGICFAIWSMGASFLVICGLLSLVREICLQRHRGEMSGWLFVCVYVFKSLQSCLTLCDPMDGSPRGSSVHGILQARVLVLGAEPSSKGSSWPRNHSCASYLSCIGRQVLYHRCHLGSPFLFTTNPFPPQLGLC